MKLNESLTLLRENDNKTQEQLSKLLKIQRSTYSKYESGVCVPSISTFCKLANIYNVPAIAVDTHVARVSKRLKLAKVNDDVLTIEKKLMKFLPKESWSKVHHQLVLFGRYICKSQKPDCLNCLFQDKCPYFKKNKLTKD